MERLGLERKIGGEYVLHQPNIVSRCRNRDNVAPTYAPTFLLLYSMQFINTVQLST